MPGCPIRISADQLVCANPRSFSQLITSFFASESLGIRHTPLFSFLCFCFLFYSVLYISIYSLNKKYFYFFISFWFFTISNFFNMSKNVYTRFILVSPWGFHQSLVISLRRYPIKLGTWWRISESNRWPPACKAGALASWANPPFY